MNHYSIHFESVAILFQQKVTSSDTVPTRIDSRLSSWGKGDDVFIEKNNNIENPRTVNYLQIFISLNTLYIYGK